MTNGSTIRPVLSASLSYHFHYGVNIMDVKKICASKSPALNPKPISTHITTRPCCRPDNSKVATPNPDSFATIKFTPRPQPAQFQHLTCTTFKWLDNEPLSSQKIAEISPPGYCFHHCPCPGHRRGGVGALVQKPLTVKLNHKKVFPSFEHIDFTISTGKTHIHIILVYHPPPICKK